MERLESRRLLSTATITWNVSFVDPGGAHQAYYANIRSGIQAAGADLARHLSTTVPSSIEVEVDLTTDTPRLAGRSATTTLVKTVDGIDIYEQGLASEIRTGTDPNGSTPDVYVQINPSYLTSTLWFDPNPTKRIAAVPTDRIDVQSLMIHELTHALTFNGWRDSNNAAITGGQESTFDQYETFDGTNIFFTGPAAEALYGGPVPVTIGDNFHVGNSAPRPGTDLVNDLMNGVTYHFGTRYDLSPLDLAMWQDTGIEVATPSSMHFDFGTPRSPVATGYTRASELTAYTAGQGFGWLIPPAGSRDRGPADSTGVSRDFVYIAGSTGATFAVDLPNGSYNVTVTMGDARVMRDDQGVFFQGVQVDNVTTQAGEVSEKTYAVTVQGGQLTLTLKDLGGLGPYTCINAMDIAAT